MAETITIYTHGAKVEVDSSVIYNPFPDDDETPESSDVGKGLDNDESTHSDDWDNDQEED